VQAAGGGSQGSGGRRGTLRPASDATWRPEMTCAFPGPDGYVLLFLRALVMTLSCYGALEIIFVLLLLYADTKMTLLFVKA